MSSTARHQELRKFYTESLLSPSPGLALGAQLELLDEVDRLQSMASKLFDGALKYKKALEVIAGSDLNNSNYYNCPSCGWEGNGELVEWSPENSDSDEYDPTCPNKACPGIGRDGRGQDLQEPEASDIAAWALDEDTPQT